MHKANGETPLDQPAVPVASEASGVGVDRSERRPKAIREAQVFIKRVGRPRVYADPVKRRRERHREWIRKDRAKKRALGSA